MDTKAQILAIARDLFARQGYRGTSIADIARALGTTPAALYYHYRSKADVLDAILAEPLAAYAELAERARSGKLGAEELLGAFIDFTAETRQLMPVVSSDPAVRALLDERLPHTPAEMAEAIIAALARGSAEPERLIEARAAYAAAKEGTVAALDLGDGTLSPEHRKVILATALRALG
ncbi:helix-turn-helix domain-containing protein [Kribbella sp. NPDC026611]|uniref:TetR/AcrR family transcriptional regulator n=1 Tax=Kribbella sp. NPDC026611 TaxID=3154911 RepID=UPI0033CB012C